MTKKSTKGRKPRDRKQNRRITPIVNEIVRQAGSQLALSKLLAPSISRPLLVALCKGTRGGTSHNVAQLCRFAQPDTAAALMKAYLDDLMEEVAATVRTSKNVKHPNSGWDGKAPVVTVFLGNDETSVRNYFAGKGLPPPYVNEIMRSTGLCSNPSIRAMLEKQTTVPKLVPGHLTYGAMPVSPK